MSDAERESARALLERHVPGLDRASPFLRADLEHHARVVRAPRGTVLFEPGHPCGGLLLVDAGSVRVSRPGPRGRELTLYRVSPTEVCVISLTCVMAESSYPARGVVERDVLGVFLPRVLFQRLNDELPAFRAFVFDALAGRLAELIDLASAVTFEHLDTRLPALLLRKCDAQGAGELALTHQALADELGTVRERVSRLLAELEARGVVELGRGRVRVLDPAALREIAAPDE